MSALVLARQFGQGAASFSERQNQQSSGSDAFWHSASTRDIITCCQRPCTPHTVNVATALCWGASWSTLIVYWSMVNDSRLQTSKPVANNGIMHVLWIYSSRWTGLHLPPKSVGSGPSRYNIFWLAIFHEYHNIYICATAFIWYLAQIHYLLCGGPISFRLLKQEVMSRYLVQTTLVAGHTISFRLL